MLFGCFEEILAWKKGQDFAVSVYTIFSSVSDYGFKDQIQRATVSTSNNIAEGFERQSNSEFIRFLYYSKDSSAKVRSMLYIARRLNYIREDQFQLLFNQIIEISKLLSGLIKSLKK